MKTRHLIIFAQSVAIIFIGCLFILAARERARANTVTAFSNYSSDWPDAWRAPVEHQAIDVLGRLLSSPEADPELVRAALTVMRKSHRWQTMANDIRGQMSGQLRVTLETVIKDRDWNRARVAWELLVLIEPDTLDLYRERIIAFGGDRSALIEAVQLAATNVQEATDMATADAALSELGRAWNMMLAPMNGQTLPWLAYQMPAMANAEGSARRAILQYHRRLLEPYGVLTDGDYGQTLPDQAMIDWLSRKARNVNAEDPRHRERLEQFQRIQRQYALDLRVEPVVATATRIAVRHEALPWSAIIPGLGIAIALLGGLIGAGLRFRRGPLPIDVNAETMENVEPIDLDTDAETKSRSAAAITDVG
jgi:hypothetical protein